MSKIEVAKNQLYSLLVDTSKNRLYIKITGFWEKESSVDSYIADQKKAIEQLKPNFTVVADMREFKTLPQELVPKQESSQKDLAEAGMYRVAEILPGSVIASMQLERVTRKTHMPNNQFSSQEEGEKWLNDELEKIK